MILLFSALAAPGLTARPQGDTLVLQVGTETARLPWSDCPWSAVQERDAVRIELHCPGTLKTPGRLRRWSWVPGQAPVTRVDDRLPDALLLEVGRQPPEEGAADLLRFGGRLQYAATPDERAALLARYAERLVEAAEREAARGHPVRAGARIVGLVQAPPVWEPERPWDYMERLRIGPPPGNRPAPERTAYLPASAGNRALLVRLERLLREAGFQAQADDLAAELARVR